MPTYLIEIGSGSRRVVLDKDTVFAQGGQALIHSDPGDDARVLKIYREEDPQAEKKLMSFFKAGFVLPDSVIAPLHPVYDSSRRFAGYQMARLDNHHQKLKALFSPSFCKDHGFSAKEKSSLFLGTGNDLLAIHGQGIVVGDVSVGNQMFSELTKASKWIDFDSAQFRGFPCPVATRLYCSPDLYTVTDFAKKPYFKPEHDWWSWCVLLFQALLNGVHPFKSGSHPRLLSFLDRAEQGVTVLDASVEYPNVGLPGDVLSDDLAQAALDILKRKRKGPFPLDILQEYGETLIKCSSCSVWYPAKRPHCPACSQKTAIQASLPKIGSIISNLIVTRGRILYYQKDGQSIYCLAEEAGDLVLYKKEENRPVQSQQIGIKAFPGAKYGIFNSCLVICATPTDDQPELFILNVSGGKVVPVWQSSTEIIAGGRAVFGTSSRFLYRIADRMLMCGELAHNGNIVERAVTQVHKRQTWFEPAEDQGSGRECLYGFTRDLGLVRWFLIVGDYQGRSFNRFDLNVAQLEKGESMADACAYAGGDLLLLARKTNKSGIDRVRLDTISVKDGKVVASQLVMVQDAERWESVRGKAYHNGVVVHATKNGLAKEVLGRKGLAVIPGTERQVTESDALVRSGGGLIVVNEDSMLEVRPQ